MVWRLDWLARSLHQLIETVDGLEKRGIALKSITEPHIDTSTPGGKLVFNIFGSIAEFERAIIRERTKAGVLRRRRAVMDPATATANHA
jgi:DNA invertase Pin-like site-specific DNA recombinase